MTNHDELIRQIDVLLPEAEALLAESKEYADPIARILGYATFVRQVAELKAMRKVLERGW